jgi:sporulation protein YlmC with PRC-barrel domain
MRSDQDAPTRRLERLSRMREYEVARNEPDPRGWKVVNRERRRVGEVKDLIVDRERMAATYLDVELDTKRFDFAGDDPHVLVPVDRADREGQTVIVEDIDSAWVNDLRRARETHSHEFWHRWWHAGEASMTRSGPEISRRAHPDTLNRVLDEVQPGETVRIPLVEEEIIVERRRVPKEEALRNDEYIVNRAADEEPPQR